MFTAELLRVTDRSEDQDGLTGEENRLAGSLLVTWEEEVVASILDDLELKWQHESLRFSECDSSGNVIESAVCDFTVWVEISPGKWVCIVIEVKRHKLGNRYQKRLAMQAGYGCAYIHNLGRRDAVARRRIVERAIEEAIAKIPEAQHMLRSTWRSRMLVEQQVQYLLIPIRQAG
jgi:hypothetical protein